MTTNINYAFSVSVSTRCFTDKEQAKSSCATIKFAPKEMDQETFLSLAGSGYAFTYIFKGNRRKPECFLNTPVIIYDIDHCEKPMEDYIAGLTFKPSLGYTSYSNGKDGKFSFRLVYCLDTPIEDEGTFNTIYSAIAVANGFGEEFDKRRINQLYFGSNQASDGYKQYISHLVYSFDDFGVSPDCVTFTGDISMDGWEGESTPTLHHTNCYERNETLSEEERISYYNNYVKSLSTPMLLSTSGTHYTYPEEYYAVPIRRITLDGKPMVKRWRDGEHRRKKLYIAALIMLKNAPDLTPDNLRFNLWALIRDYFDNTCDDRITSTDIDGIVKRAMANRDKDILEPSHHGQFKLNKEYWLGEVDSVLEAVKAVRKERNMAKMEHFDWTISVAANQREMEKKGYKLSPSTIYRYVKEMGIPRRDLDAEIIELMKQDPTITTTEISSALGKSRSAISRHIKKMREAEEPRVRRIKNRWVIQDAEENTSA